MIDLESFAQVRRGKKRVVQQTCFLAYGDSRQGTLACPRDTVHVQPNKLWATHLGECAKELPLGTGTRGVYSMKLTSAGLEAKSLDVEGRQSWGQAGPSWSGGESFARKGSEEDGSRCLRWATNMAHMDLLGALPPH